MSSHTIIDSGRRLALYDLGVATSPNDVSISDLNCAIEFENCSKKMWTGTSLNPENNSSDVLKNKVDTDSDMSNSGPKVDDFYRMNKTEQNILAIIHPKAPATNNTSTQQPDGAINDVKQDTKTINNGAPTRQRSPQLQSPTVWALLSMIWKTISNFFSSKERKWIHPNDQLLSTTITK